MRLALASQPAPFINIFKNKHELLQLIAQLRYETLRQEVKPFELRSDTGSQSAIVDTFEIVLGLIYDVHAQNPELDRVLEQRRHLDPELGKIIAEGEAVLQARVLQFVQCFNLPDAEIVALNLYAMAEGLVHRHVLGRSGFDKAKVVRSGAQMLAAYFSQTNENQN